MMIRSGFLFVVNHYSALLKQGVRHLLGGLSIVIASPSPTENDLLAALPAADYKRLAPHLEPIPLVPGLALYEPGSTQKYVYFPTHGIVSLNRRHAGGAPRTRDRGGRPSAGRRTDSLQSWQDRCAGSARAGIPRLRVICSGETGNRSLASHVNAPPGGLGAREVKWQLIDTLYGQMNPIHSHWE